MNPNEALQQLLGGQSGINQDSMDPVLGVMNEGSMENDPFEATRRQAAALLLQQDQERQLAAQATAAVTPIVQEAVDIQQALVLDDMAPKGLPDGWSTTTEAGVYRKGEPGKGVKGKPTEYTNVVDSEGKPTMQAPYAPLANPGGAYVSQQDTRVSGNISSMISAMRAAQGPEAKMSVLASLQEAAAMETSKAYQAAQQQADMKLGVTSLEQLLAQNEAADRAHPMWNKVQSDSEETARVRSQLESARMKAAALADTYLKQNPAVAAMQAQVKAAGSMLELDLRNQQRKEAREDQQKFREENREDQQNFRTEERQAMEKEKERIRQEELLRKEEEAARRYRPVQFARMRMLDPDLSQETDTGIAKILASGKKALSPEMDTIIKADDTTLLKLAATRNQEAAKIVIEEEAAKTGVSPVELRQKLAKLSSNMSTEGYRRAMVDRYKDTTSAEYKQSMALVTKMSSGLNKDEQTALNDQLFSTAVGAMQVENTREWISNISNWKFSDQRLQDTAASIQNTTGKPASLSDLAMKLRADYSRDKITELAEALRKDIFNNKREGILTATDPNAAWGQAQLDLSRSLLMKGATEGLNVLADFFAVQPVKAGANVVKTMFGIPYVTEESPKALDVLLMREKK